MLWCIWFSVKTFHGFLFVSESNKTLVKVVHSKDLPNEHWSDCWKNFDRPNCSLSPKRFFTTRDASSLSRYWQYLRAWEWKYFWQSLVLTLLENFYIRWKFSCLPLHVIIWPEKAHLMGNMEIYKENKSF